MSMFNCWGDNVDLSLPSQVWILTATQIAIISFFLHFFWGLFVNSLTKYTCSLNLNVVIFRRTNCRLAGAAITIVSFFLLVCLYYLWNKDEYIPQVTWCVHFCVTLHGLHVSVVGSVALLFSSGVQLDRHSVSSDSRNDTGKQVI